MASPNVRAVTDQSFEAEVLKSPLPVLVAFNATWCGPCRAQAPIIEKVADDYCGKVKVVTIDIDESTEVTRKYSVRSVPMCMVFQGGQKIGIQAGLTKRETLLKLLAL